MKRKIIYTIIAIFIWCLIWHIAAIIIDNDIFLPSPADTLLSLADLIRTPDFFRSILVTLKGIALGFLIGELHTKYYKIYMHIQLKIR